MLQKNIPYHFSLNIQLMTKCIVESLATEYILLNCEFQGHQWEEL
jgi:hypothetical protein